MNITSVYPLFFLRKSASSYSVYLRITIDGERLDISMNKSCHLDEWDSNLGRVKTKTQEANLLNAFLDAKELEIKELHSEFILRGSRLTIASFRAKYFGEDEERPRILWKLP